MVSITTSLSPGTLTSATTRNLLPSKASSPILGFILTSVLKNLNQCELVTGWRSEPGSPVWCYPYSPCASKALRHKAFQELYAVDGPDTTTRFQNRSNICGAGIPARQMVVWVGIGGLESPPHKEVRWSTMRVSKKSCNAGSPRRKPGLGRLSKNGFRLLPERDLCELF